MTLPCEHAAENKNLDETCNACKREAQKVRAERDAIIALIEDTVKTWDDGKHPMVEVLLARIRART